MTRVLVVAPTPFFSDYGAHVRIAEEARALRARGHEIEIITYRAGGPYADFPIRRIRAGPRTMGFGPNLHRTYLDLFLARLMGRTLREFQPDVVHAHLHEGMLVSALCGAPRRVPVVLDAQGSLSGEIASHRFPTGGRVGLAMIEALEKWLVHRADHVVVSSHHLRDIMVARFGCAPEQVTPVLDGVDCARFAPDGSVRDKMRRQLGYEPRHRVAVFLGQLTDIQGIPLLLDAAAELAKEDDDFRLLVLGYPNVERYRRLANEKGVSAITHFQGRVDYIHEAPTFLSAGDIAVAPKLNLSESNGKILNYMAMGLPTVTFGFDINRLFLRELGTYAAGTSSDALAAAMARAFRSDAPARQALRARVEEEFSWDAGAKALERVFDAVLAARGMHA